MWLEQGERQEAGTKKSATGHEEDFGFSLTRPQAIGGYLVTDLTSAFTSLCCRGGAHAGPLCSQPVVLSLGKSDQKCSWCRDSVAQKGPTNSGGKRVL